MLFHLTDFVPFTSIKLLFYYSFITMEIKIRGQKRQAKSSRVRTCAFPFLKSFLIFKQNPVKNLFQVEGHMP